MFAFEEELDKHKIKEIDFASPKRQIKHRMQFQGCLQENVDEKSKNKEKNNITLNELTFKFALNFICLIVCTFLYFNFILV